MATCGRLPQRIHGDVVHQFHSSLAAHVGCEGDTPARVRRMIYKVKMVARKRPDKVVAEYFRIADDGVLYFRNTSRAPGGYPEFVKCYAKGSWVSIENVTVKEPDHAAV